MPTRQLLSSCPEQFCSDAHVVEPVNGEAQRNGTGRVEDEVEQAAVVVVAVESIIEVGLKARVDVTVVELAVEREEDLVCASLSVLRQVGAERDTNRGSPGER